MTPTELMNSKIENLQNGYFSATEELLFDNFMEEIRPKVLEKRHVRIEFVRNYCFFCSFRLSGFRRKEQN